MAIADKQPAEAGLLVKRCQLPLAAMRSCQADEVRAQSLPRAYQARLSRSCLNLDSAA